jgi:hypothetical protein
LNHLFIFLPRAKPAPNISSRQDAETPRFYNKKGFLCASAPLRENISFTPIQQTFSRAKTQRRRVSKTKNLFFAPLRLCARTFHYVAFESRPTGHASIIFSICLK